MSAEHVAPLEFSTSRVHRIRTVWWRRSGLVVGCALVALVMIVAIAIALALTIV